MHTLRRFGLTDTSAAEPFAEVAHLQRSWDRASIKHASEILFDNASTDRDRALLIAVSSPHSGDWLHALPVSSCGLRLDDEAIRVAIGLRLGTPLCAEHTCNCGAWVDCMGTMHGLSCELGTGRLARHQQLNDLVWSTFYIRYRPIPTLKKFAMSLDTTDCTVYSPTVRSEFRRFLCCAL